MKEKIREAIYKLKNTTLAVNNALIYCNVYSIKKVYFGVETMNI